VKVEDWYLKNRTLSLEEVYVTNILEDDLESIEVVKNSESQSIEVKLRAFEVKTLRLVLK